MKLLEMAKMWKKKQEEPEEAEQSAPDAGADAEDKPME